MWKRLIAYKINSYTIIAAGLQCGQSVRAYNVVAIHGGSYQPCALPFR
jgi:hypothetical protein